VARPKSDDKRNAILRAAACVIDTQGLGAPTALIAKEAGVANGTLFTYFATKADLLNQLYLELKKEMANAAQSGLSGDEEPREQLLHVWTNWMRWAIAHPESRRAMAQLAASEEISPATREEGALAMARIGALIERIRTKGPMRNTPMDFIAEITESIAGTTMDYMVRNPANADDHCKAGFEALWRVVGGT
jgi:AcrR family transcriptional regulator